LLLVDGWQALKERDWKAFVLAGVPAVVSSALYPTFFSRISHTEQFSWSVSTLGAYGILAAVLAAVVLAAMRWTRRKDLKTLAILLGPVWTPYMLQYSCTAVLFTMRKAGWLRNIIYLLASIGLAALFWRDYHSYEPLGVLGMVLLAALLAPAYDHAPVPALEAAPTPAPVAEK
jgi:uncharacterized membrane protein